MNSALYLSSGTKASTDPSSLYVCMLEDVNEFLIEPVKSKKWLGPKPEFSKEMQKYRFSSTPDQLAAIESHETLK